MLPPVVLPPVVLPPVVLPPVVLLLVLELVGDVGELAGDGVGEIPVATSTYAPHGSPGTRVGSVRSSAR